MRREATNPAKMARHAHEGHRGVQANPRGEGEPERLGEGGERFHDRSVPRATGRVSASRPRVGVRAASYFRVAFFLAFGLAAAFSAFDVVRMSAACARL